MEITFFGYNTFLIKTKNKKILIDPGGGFYLFKGWLKTLVPKEEWPDITHIFVTHGDPDHYWHVDRIAEKSGAPVICNKTLVKEDKSKSLETVDMIKPKLVIPCHYNCGGLHRKNANPADAKYFHDEVKKLGFDCALLKERESIEL